MTKTSFSGPKVPHITIIGRRWFQRSAGNTYNSVRIMIDGKTVAVLPKAYGYGDQYYQRAGEWLADNNYVSLERHSNGSLEPLHSLRDRGEIGLEYWAEDVTRERDL
jgi:hypothetical protein